MRLTTKILALSILIVMQPLLAEAVVTSAVIPNVSPLVEDCDAVIDGANVFILVNVRDLNGAADLNAVECFITHETNLNDSFENTTRLYNVSLSRDRENAGNVTYNGSIQMDSEDAAGNYYVEVIASDKSGASGAWMNYTSPIIAFTYSPGTVPSKSPSKSGGNRKGTYPPDMTLRQSADTHPHNTSCDGRHVEETLTKLVDIGTSVQETIVTDSRTCSQALQMPGTARLRTVISEFGGAVLLLLIITLIAGGLLRRH